MALPEALENGLALKIRVAGIHRGSLTIQSTAAPVYWLGGPREFFSG
jgi:hypothetical protein